MTDFGTLIDSMKSDALDPADDSEMKRHVVAALSYYRGKRFEFTEKHDTFDTVASQQSYTAGDTGFPVGIYDIDFLRLEIGTRLVPIEMMLWKKFRELETLTTVVHEPRAAAWYAARSTSTRHRRRSTRWESTSSSTPPWTPDRGTKARRSQSTPTLPSPTTSSRSARSLPENQGALHLGDDSRRLGRVHDPDEAAQHRGQERSHGATQQAAHDAAPGAGLLLTCRRSSSPSST